MSIEILKTLDPERTKEYLKIFMKVYKTDSPAQFIEEFADYTTNLRRKSKNGEITISKFSFQQYLLAKILNEGKAPPN